MAIPDNITKDDVISAVNKINNEGVKSTRHPTNHYVIYNGKLYPPKYILEIANLLKNGEHLNVQEYNSLDSLKFLSRFELKIVTFNIANPDIAFILKTKKVFNIWEGNQNEAYFKAQWDEVDLENISFPVIGIGYYELENAQDISILKINNIERGSFSFGDIKVTFDLLEKSSISSQEFISKLPFEDKSRFIIRKDIRFIKNLFPNRVFNLTSANLSSENNIDEIKINTILYGPPGTGKTFCTKEYSLNITNMNILKDENNNQVYDRYLKEGKIKFITFHPSYSYEDFIEGIRPVLKKSNENGENIKFELKDGIFKDICLMSLNSLCKYNFSSWEEFSTILENVKEIVSKELENHHEKFVLIIDEINRGDISKIFGELITLIEDDKRLGKENQLIVQLPYSGHYFGIPPNLYILGTMNTADRSLALIDVALRRRFYFKEMYPEFEDLKANPSKYKSKEFGLFIQSIHALINVNTILGKNPDIGKDKKIGHAYLSGIQNEKQLILIWKEKLLPLLEEYYFFDKESLVELSNKYYSVEKGWDSDSISFIVDHFSNLKDG